MRPRDLVPARGHENLCERQQVSYNDENMMSLGAPLIIITVIAAGSDGGQDQQVVGHFRMSDPDELRGR